MTAFDLPPTTDSVPAARRRVRQILDGLGDEVDVEIATLLLSEIVTNAVLHARTEIRVDVNPSAGQVRISVHDGSPVHPRIHAHSAMSATGRGLRLVADLAQRWGVDPEPTGKVVWFEVGAPSDAAWGMFETDWLAEGVSNDV